MDPFGRQSFSAAVVNALSGACDRLRASTNDRLKVQVSAVTFQADSFSCGPLALLVMETWETYVDSNVRTDFLEHLECLSDLTQRRGGSNAGFVQAVREKS